MFDDFAKMAKHKPAWQGRTCAMHLKFWKLLLLLSLLPAALLAGECRVLYARTAPALLGYRKTGPSLLDCACNTNVMFLLLSPAAQIMLGEECVGYA